MMTFLVEYVTPLRIAFYLFASLALCASVLVILAKNPVYSVLALVLTFFGMACVWITLHAEFLALILLLVYVGAVMTLFLFVVMMLDVNKTYRFGSYMRYWPFGLLLILLLTGLLLLGVGPAYFGLDHIPSPLPQLVKESNLVQLGNELYTNYAYPFEIAGIILMAAMICAIVLTHRVRSNKKAQNPRDQIAVRAQDRVRLVKGKL